MIRKLLLTALSLIFLAQGYTQAKRFVFMEHFTNSRCGVCAGSNPAYYNLLNNYKGHYHHISIHPPIPYSACLLYQANKDDQSQRSNFYNILGTPTIVFNGQTKKSASGVNASFLDSEIKKESAIQLVVSETGSNSKNAIIEIKTIGQKPGGKYRLYVAITERVLNYASPNGEKVHYDVFRDFASAVNGDEIDLADQGGSIVKSYQYLIQPSWNEKEMYIIAWVQDETTKEVINSGTKFDVVSSTDQLKQLNFSIQPNPVQGKLNVHFPNSTNKNARLVITNLLGREIVRTQLNLQNNSFEMNVQHFEKGIYFAKIESGGLSLTKKWVKQ
ncbi:MAG: Omp28-related outer membrane protein [Saprospiraceae bacterium]|nr:Omp28-related outer membrane protein [Saprospiraceae bacterium]